MQRFTKTEIGWIADLLEAQARSCRELAAGSQYAALYRLKLEQYEAMASKLRTTLEENSRRIEITY